MTKRIRQKRREQESEIGRATRGRERGKAREGEGKGERGIDSEIYGEGKTGGVRAVKGVHICSLC